jgi:hypothetical protein
VYFDWAGTNYDNDKSFSHSIARLWTISENDALDKYIVMKKYVCMLMLLIIFYSDHYVFGKQKTRTREISIFRITGFFKNFYLKINDDFYYQEKNKTKGNAALGYFITKYKTNRDTLHLYLKINNRDTSFDYVLTKYDSLMLGGGDDYFFCWTKKEYIWAND